MSPINRSSTRSCTSTGTAVASYLKVHVKKCRSDPARIEFLQLSFCRCKNASSPTKLAVLDPVLCEQPGSAVLFAPASHCFIFYKSDFSGCLGIASDTKSFSGYSQSSAYWMISGFNTLTKYTASPGMYGE